MDKSSQHIRDFKLAIEFKYLMKHAPAGVYLMPEFDDIRKLHGVIFVRRGLYRDGVFRFTMSLPQMYNDEGTHPIITFTPPVFNPLVDPNTGILDLTVDESLREWQPDKHFIVTAVTFLKKIFYLKDYDGFERFANPEAKSL
jgi:ubiquitin-protein ligase